MSGKNQDNEKRFIKNYDRIKKIINYAKETDYYSKLFDSICLDIDNLTYNDFKKIPCLTKDLYRNNCFKVIRSSIINGFDEEKYYRSSMNEKDLILKEYNLTMRMTSGSTGKPLEVIKSYTDNLYEYTAINYHRKKLYQVDLSQPFVWIWPVSPYFLKEVDEIKKISPINNGFRYLMSSFSNDEFFLLTEYLKKNNIKWITSSPSMLYAYSNFLIQNEIVVNLDYIESHSEPLSTIQSNTIKKALGIKPVNVYGSNEVQFIGMTCPNEHMHILDNNVFVEIEINKYGYEELIVTSLNCCDSIFIRYRIGDCAALQNIDVKCSYNKNEVLSLKNYRSNDLAISRYIDQKYEPHLITASIYALEEKFSIKIKNFRIIQKSFTEFLFYVEIETLKNEYRIFLERYLTDLFGYSIEVQMRQYHAYIGTYEGKYKYFSIDKNFANMLENG